MGFMTGNFPPVDPATFIDKPYRERLKTETLFDALRARNDFRKLLQDLAERGK